jgi:hypothetical protein
MRGPSVLSRIGQAKGHKSLPPADIDLAHDHIPREWFRPFVKSPENSEVSRRRP